MIIDETKKILEIGKIFIPLDNIIRVDLHIIKLDKTRIAKLIIYHHADGNLYECENNIKSDDIEDVTNLVEILRDMIKNNKRPKKFMKILEEHEVCFGVIGDDNDIKFR